MRRAGRGGRLALTVVALSVLGLAGCGGSDRTDGGASAEPAVTVAVSQIGAEPAGTPQRTVLHWWRDVQLNDPEHARGLYLAPPALPSLAGQFNFVAGELAGSVEVVAVERRGERAVVRVRWEPAPGQERRATLRLGEDGGGWKLLDARFLDQLVADKQRAEAG